MDVVSPRYRINAIFFTLLLLRKMSFWKDGTPNFLNQKIWNPDYGEELCNYVSIHENPFIFTYRCPPRILGLWYPWVICEYKTYKTRNITKSSISLHRFSNSKNAKMTSKKLSICVDKTLTKDFLVCDSKTNCGHVKSGQTNCPVESVSSLVRKIFIKF